MEWLPRLKLEVESVAWPEDKVLEPSDLVPSLKVTLPVGTAVPGALATTVAVKVTDWPWVDGLSDEVTELVVPSLFTVWVRTEEVLPVKLVLPPSTAVMECDPTVRVEVVKVALPLPSRVPVPKVELPFLKVTVPLGTPLPGAVAVTGAVKVTGWLKTDGLADELTAVVVADLFTTWGEPLSLPLLFAQPVPPVKAAVIVLLPTASAAVLNAAWPLLSTTTFEASTLLPWVKVTVPTGAPELEVTLAVKLTDCPKVDGLGVEVTVVVVAKFCTVCTVLPLLAAKLKSEAYVAVMVSLPVASADVLKAAAPLEFKGTWASTVLPCWNVTWPVGVPVPGGTAVSVAVKVTDCPPFEGLGVEASAVDDPLAWTVCTSDALPALKLESPLYCTVMK